MVKAGRPGGGGGGMVSGMSPRVRHRECAPTDWPVRTREGRCWPGSRECTTDGTRRPHGLLRVWRPVGGGGVDPRSLCESRPVIMADTPPPPRNERWRDANRRCQRQTIRCRGLVPTPPPPGGPSLGLPLPPDPPPRSPWSPQHTQQASPPPYPPPPPRPPPFCAGRTYCSPPLG